MTTYGTREEQTYARLIAEGWTSESAYAHVHASCDREYCGAAHDEDGKPVLDHLPTDPVEYTDLVGHVFHADRPDSMRVVDAKPRGNPVEDGRWFAIVERAETSRDWLTLRFATVEVARHPETGLLWCYHGHYDQTLTEAVLDLAHRV